MFIDHAETEALMEMLFQSVFALKPRVVIILLESPWGDNTDHERIMNHVTKARGYVCYDAVSNPRLCACRCGDDTAKDRWVLMGILRGTGLSADAHDLIPHPMNHGFLPGTEPSVADVLDPVYLVPCESWVSDSMQAGRTTPSTRGRSLRPSATIMLAT